MKLEINELSSIYRVNQLEVKDIPEILSLCKGNPLYYKYYKPEASAESIENDLYALPPGKTLEDKYFVGLYDGQQMVAVLDLIVGYPNIKSAYIGWFMVHKEYQGDGLGTRLVCEIIDYLAEKKFRDVQLCYVKGNEQAETFWLKNKFTPIDEEVERQDYTIIKMCRVL